MVTVRTYILVLFIIPGRKYQKYEDSSRLLIKWSISDCESSICMPLKVLKIIWCLTVKCTSAFIENVVLFLLYVANMVNCIDCILNLKPSLHYWSNSTWSWCIGLFLHITGFDLLIFRWGFLCTYSWNILV